MGIIYKTINSINGKMYVGSDSRNNPSYLGSGAYLSRAIKKYGKENFRKTTIDTWDCKDQRDLKEKFWISFYNSKTVGYNIADGGDGGNLGVDVNRRISESLMGHEVSDAARKNISLALKGRPSNTKGKKMSAETRLRMSKAARIRERLKWAVRKNGSQ